MEELQITAQANEWSFMNNESCFYTGCVKQGKGEQLLELKNSYHTPIISLTTMKSGGFHLFRSNKAPVTNILQNGNNGSIIASDNGYVWEAGECYRFYACMNQNELQLVMCDRGSTLGCVKGNHIYMKALMYSSVLCAFWLWLKQRQLQKDTLIYDEAYVREQMEKL